jgi:hypothetical protein
VMRLPRFRRKPRLSAVDLELLLLPYRVRR